MSSQRKIAAIKLLSKLSEHLLVTAILTIASASHSYADGVPGGYGGPPAACCFTWTGFYFGVNGGGAWTDSHSIRFTGTGGLGSEIADGTTPSQAPLDWSKSFTGGAQIGYNVQLGSALVGVEADVQWLNAYANFVVVSTNPLRPAITTSADREMSMLATLRARLGMTLWERSLLYVTGGLARGDTTLRVSSSCPNCNPLRDVTSSSATTPVGWVYGAGYEVALTRWLMVKAEYLHYDLGSNSTTVTYDYPGNTSSMTGKVHDEGNVVRVGVNFRLDQPNTH
jgi:outer membrane immunogenic protein